MDASQLVAALEVAWAGIQGRHPDVPSVVVTLGAGSVGVPAGTLRLGHFAARRWVTDPADPGGVAELFVGGEGLRSGSESVLATLLHEAAHGVAHTRGIQDTSRQGRYHNARFKALGEEVGLVITKTDPIGWSGTALGPAAANEYAEELQQLARAIVAYRHAEGQIPGGTDDGDDEEAGDEGEGAGGRRPKNGVVLLCGCRRKIRASTAVVEAGPIVCGICGDEFAPAP